MKKDYRVSWAKPENLDKVDSAESATGLARLDWHGHDRGYGQEMWAQAANEWLAQVNIDMATKQATGPNETGSLPVSNKMLSPGYRWWALISRGTGSLVVVATDEVWPLTSQKRVGKGPNAVRIGGDIGDECSHGNGWWVAHKMSAVGRGVQLCSWPGQCHKMAWMKAAVRNGKENIFYGSQCCNGSGLLAGGLPRSLRWWPKVVVALGLEILQKCKRNSQKNGMAIVGLIMYHTDLAMLRDLII